MSTFSCFLSSPTSLKMSTRLQISIHHISVCACVNRTVIAQVNDVFIIAADEITPPRHTYFDVLLRLEWSNDPESYAGGSVAIGRVSGAGQVEGDDP